MGVQAKMFNLPLPSAKFGKDPDVVCKIRGPGNWKCRSVVQLKETTSDDYIYGVSFVPRLEGVYKVQVLVNKSPYQTFDIEVAPRNDENSRPSNRPSPREELRRQQQEKLNRMKRTKSNIDNVQNPEKRSSKRGNKLRHRNTIASYHNQEEPASDASGSPSNRQARKKKRSIAETTRRCCVCLSPVKERKDITFDGRIYCKTDFSNMFLIKKSFFGLGSRTNDSPVTLKGLSFNDVKRAQKYFADAESYGGDRVAFTDGHKIIRHMLKKKLKVNPLTPVMKDRIRTVLHEHVKSEATMTEVQMLYAFSVVAGEYTRTRTLLGKRTSKSNVKEVIVDADDDNERFVAGKFVQDDDDEDDKGFFTGDKRADGWMLY